MKFNKDELRQRSLTSPFNNPRRIKIVISDVPVYLICNNERYKRNLFMKKHEEIDLVNK